MYQDKVYANSTGDVADATGAVQASVTVSGTGTASFDITLKTHTSGFLDRTTGNGIELVFDSTVGHPRQLELAANYRTITIYYGPSGVYNINSWRTLCINLGGDLFTVSAITGDRTEKVRGTSWTFASGAQTAAGSTQVNLSGQRDGIQVGDYAFFKEGFTPDRYRRISGVTVGDTNTTITWDRPADFAYASGTSIDIERDIGYGSDVALIPSKTAGNLNYAGAQFDVEFGRGEVEAGDYLYTGLSYTGDYPRNGKPVHRDCRIVSAWICMAYDSLVLTDTSKPSIARLWKNDAHDNANFIAELRYTKHIGVLHRYFNGPATMFTGEVNSYSQNGLNSNSEEEVTELWVDEGDTIIVEWEKTGGGLIDPAAALVSLGLQYIHN